MADLTIQKINEVYLQVKTEPHIEYELRDRFTFEVPNKKFMPQYRSKYWDGYVHLFNMKTKRIYVGLLDKVVAFCEQSGYSYKSFKLVTCTHAPTMCTEPGDWHHCSLIVPPWYLSTTTSKVQLKKCKIVEVNSKYCANIGSWRGPQLYIVKV